MNFRLVTRMLVSSALFLAPAIYSQDYRPLIQEMLGKVSADSMMKCIRQLETFPTRSSLSPHHDSAAGYIQSELKRSGVTVEADWLDCCGQSFTGASTASESTFCVVAFQIYRTTDGGKSWASQGNPTSDRINGVHFATKSVGFAVGAYGGIMRTTDAGKTWNKQSSGSTRILLDVKCMSEQSAVAVGGIGEILRTSDGGVSWTKVESGVTGSLNEIEVVDSLSLWVVGNAGVVLRSSDAGNTWLRLTVPTNANLNAIEVHNRQNIWVAGAGRVALRTADGGQTWSALTIPSDVDENLRSVLLRDSISAFLVHGQGVIATTDGGLTWVNILSHENAGLYKIRSNGSQGLIVCGNPSVVYTSTNNGASWNRSGISFRSRNIVGKIFGRRSPEKECVIMAHYDSFSLPGALQTAPGANDNASGVSAVLEAARIMQSYEFENTIVFLALTNEEIGGDGSNHYASTAKNQGRAVLGAVNGDMIGLAGPGNRFYVGYYQNQNKLVDSALAFNARYSLGLFLTTLNTALSDHVRFTNNGYDAIVIMEYTSDPLYHTTFDTAGRLIPTALSGAAKLMLATVAELAHPLGKTTNVPVQVGVPLAYSLEQNFPNPFNPSTIISYSVPKDAIVSLRIFNLIGQEVASLVNERKEAGYHTVEWNANVSSGIYFYRLQAGDASTGSARGFVETKKMILLR